MIRAKASPHILQQEIFWKRAAATTRGSYPAWCPLLSCLPHAPNHFWKEKNTSWKGRFSLWARDWECLRNFKYLLWKNKGQSYWRWKLHHHYEMEFGCSGFLHWLSVFTGLLVNLPKSWSPVVTKNELYSSNSKYVWYKAKYCIYGINK